MTSFTGEHKTLGLVCFTFIDCSVHDSFQVCYVKINCKYVLKYYVFNELTVFPVIETFAANKNSFLRNLSMQLYYIILV